MTATEIIEAGIVGGIVQALVVWGLAKLGLFPGIAIFIKE